MILMIIVSVRTKMIIVMKITLFKLRHGQFIKMQIKSRRFLIGLSILIWGSTMITLRTIHDVCMLPSWQLNILLHSLTSALLPLQCFPPYAGSGLEHSLNLICMPMAVLVQILQGLHSLQPPLTNNVSRTSSRTTLKLCFGRSHCDQVVFRNYYFLLRLKFSFKLKVGKIFKHLKHTLIEMCLVNCYF